MDKPDVVVVLPFDRVRRVLLQLRDAIPGIVFPGHWGFFGGAISLGEVPEAAAYRETEEELGLKPSSFIFLGTDSIPEQSGLVAHAFAFRLTVPVDSIQQREGMDMMLVSLSDVTGGMLMSPRQRKFFPVVPTKYLSNTLRRVALIENYHSTARIVGSG
jgi:8-oxo-dGTP pyrophosphatase MutT (NUDIX family)